MHIIGFDIETNCLNPFDEESKILTAATYDGSISHAFAFTRSYEWLRNFLESLSINTVLVGHNLVLFDLYWCIAKLGIDFPKCQILDTMILYSLLNENNENSLDALADKFTNLKKNENELDRRYLETYPIEDVLEYNKQDARISYALYEPLIEKAKEKDIDHVYDLMIELSKTLVKMMVRGVKADLGWWDIKQKETKQELEKLESLFCKIAGDDFNIRSTKQLAELLYGKLGLPIKERSKKTKNPSTKSAVLRLLQNDPLVPNTLKDFVGKIINYREYNKLEGSFLSPLKDEHTKNDGRVHTTFNVGRYFSGVGSEFGTRTGRLSSSNPNLQNIPRGQTVRGGFIPSDGFKLFNADYSQIELRVAGWESGDMGMLEAFLSGRDIHTQTLALMKGWEYERAVEYVDTGSYTAKEDRTIAKTCNFLILYGGTGYRLHKTLMEMGIYKSIKECDTIVEQWFSAYPSLKFTIDEWKKEILETGRIKNAFGRFRHLPDAFHESEWKRERALRQGVNFRIQSLAGEIMAKALVELGKILLPLDAHLLLQVHDSAVGEYPDTDFCCTIVEKLIRVAMVDRTAAYFEEHGVPNLHKILDVDIEMDLERWQ